MRGAALAYDFEVCAAGFFDIERFEERCACARVRSGASRGFARS